MPIMKWVAVVFAVSAVLFPAHAAWADTPATSDESDESECGNAPVRPESEYGLQDAWATWTACLQKHRPLRIDKVQSANDVVLECAENFFSMVDVDECLVRKAKESEVTLQQAEKKLRAAIDAWDQEEEYVRVAKRKLTVSGKAFVMYRATMCSFAHSMGGLGMHLSNLVNACVVEQNNRRAEQLLDHAKSLFPRGMSTLKWSLKKIEGRFDWLPEQNAYAYAYTYAYTYSKPQELERSVHAHFPLAQQEEAQLPAALLAELVDCLDDTLPTESTFNDQPVPVGWLCHAALTKFIYPEVTAAGGDVAPDWAGNLKLPASPPQSMGEVKAAWRQVISSKQYKYK